MSFLCKNNLKTFYKGGFDLLSFVKETMVIQSRTSGFTKKMESTLSPKERMTTSDLKPEEPHPTEVPAINRSNKTTNRLKTQMQSQMDQK